LPEKSPALPGSRNIKGAYSEDVAAAIAGVRDHFPPSNFSMSPEGLSALIALVPQPLHYLSIDEDAAYAASIRRGVSIGGARYGGVQVTQLEIVPSDTKVTLVGGGWHP
jgi:hypothetical protein